MKIESKQLLLYVALLVLTLGVAVLVPEWRFIYYFLIVFPLLAVPIAFGFMLRSWWQFLVYLSITVLGWQLSFAALYWIKGILGETLRLMYEEGTLGYEILKNCIMSVFLVSVGAIMGRLHRIRSLR